MQKESVTSILKDMRNFMLSKKTILSVDELEKYCGIKKSTIYKLTSARQIPFYKPGNKLIFFKRTEIDEWLMQRSFSVRSR
jgi:prophage regulatory protein